MGGVGAGAGGVAVIWLVMSGETACCSGVDPHCRVFQRGFGCGGERMPAWVSGSKELLESDFGESYEDGIVGGVPGFDWSSSEEFAIQPPEGTLTFTSPSCACSLGGFFFGGVSGDELTWTL